MRYSGITCNTLQMVSSTWQNYSIKIINYIKEMTIKLPYLQYEEMMFLGVFCG